MGLQFRVPDFAGVHHFLKMCLQGGMMQGVEVAKPMEIGANEIIV
jgi:hypothetical protein